jgi:cytochrome b involved in lipid metabolism
LAACRRRLLLLLPLLLDDIAPRPATRPAARRLVPEENTIITIQLLVAAYALFSPVYFTSDTRMSEEGEAATIDPPAEDGGEQPVADASASSVIPGEGALEAGVVPTEEQRAAVVKEEDANAAAPPPDQVALAANEGTEADAVGGNAAAADENGLAAADENGLAAADENGLAAADENGLAAADENSLAAADENSLAAADENSLAAADENSLAAADENGLAAAEENSLAAAEENSLAAADENSLAAAEENGLAAADENSLAAENDLPAPSNGDASAEEAASGAQADERSDATELPAHSEPAIVPPAPHADAAPAKTKGSPQFPLAQLTRSGDLPYYTPAQVASHAVAADCWLSLLGKVIDVTGVVRSEHPELVQSIVAAAGCDVSHWFTKDGELKTVYDLKSGLRRYQTPVQYPPSIITANLL